MFDKSELQQRISNLLANGYGSKKIVELVEEKFTSTNTHMVQGPKVQIHGCRYCEHYPERGDYVLKDYNYCPWCGRELHHA